MGDLVPFGRGGSRKGGSGKTPQSAANTLRSRAKVRMTWLLAEGQIERVDQLHIDGTPLTALDGSPNFRGISWDFRPGSPDQDHFPSAPNSETPFPVGVPVTQRNGPITRSVVDRGADAVRVILNIQSLYTINRDNGTAQPNTLHYVVKVRPNGGSWLVVVSEVLRNEKCMSPVQLSHVVRLPEGGHPWDIAVEKITPDATDPAVAADEMAWESYSVVTEGKFSYPHSALVYIELDAEQFGSTQPVFTFEGRWLQTPVPSNYDPVTRSYSGIWNGTFVTRNHSNPAWVLYDLIVNDRYGLGEYVDVSRVDKMSFYHIGRYCDQLVPSGFKNANGDDRYEPRFSFDGVISSRQEAFALLNAVANCFRGQTYWSHGQIYAVADMPEDPATLVVPADVYKGTFEYSGVDEVSVHSAVTVGWNDPSDHYRPATELVVNDDALLKYDWRSENLPLLGVTSRGQAARFGRWVLDSELHEDETIQYAAAWSQIELRPYSIISVADPRKAAFRSGGLLRGVDVRRFHLDAAIDISSGEGFEIGLTLVDGTVEWLPVEAFEWTTPEGFSELARTTRAPRLPVDVGTVWQVRSQSANPRQYRVLSIQEESPGFYKVTALFHDPTKYKRVEEGIILDPIRYTRPARTIKPPTNLRAIEEKFFENATPRTTLSLSWTPGDDFMSQDFLVAANTPRGYQDFGVVAQPSLAITDATAGRYEIVVYARSINGLVSAPATLSVDVSSWAGADAPVVSNLRLSTGGTEFVGNAPIILWTPIFASGPQTAGNVFHLYTQVRVFDTRGAQPRLLRTERVSTDTYTYAYSDNFVDTGGKPSRFLSFEVTIYDTFGRPSIAQSIAVSNLAPAAPVVSVKAGFNQIFTAWQSINDPDIAGADVHISDDPAFVPSDANLAYRGAGSSHVELTPIIKQYYVRVGLFDSFGAPEHYSTPIEVTPIASTIDTEPPARPTGFEIRSTAIAAGRAAVEFSWKANTEEDLAGYRLSARLNDGNEVTLPIASTSYQTEVPAGTRIRARLQAYDRMSNVSLSTPTIDHTAAKDDVPPATPTGFEGVSSFGGAWFDWDPNSEPDLARYEIYISDKAGAPPADAAVSVTSGNTHLQQSEAKVYAAVRAVDTSGNVSPWTNVVGITPLTDADVKITGEQIEGIVGRTSFAAGLTPVEIVATLPTVNNFEGRISFTGGKLYRFTNGAWTSAVPTADLSGTITSAQIASLAAAKLTGQITSVQITDNAISAPKIAAGAIVAEKLAALAVTTEKLSAFAITADKLAAGAVTTEKLVAGAVTAATIAAGAVQATQLSADAVQARHLAIGDFTNMLPDSELQEPGAWALTNGASISVTGWTGFRSKGQINSPTGIGSGVVLARSKFIPVQAGDQLSLLGQAVQHANQRTSHRFLIAYFDAALSATTTLEWANDSYATAGGRNYEGAVTVPTTARFMRLEITSGADGTAAGSGVAYGGFSIRRRNEGRLVVDGSITAGKLTTGEVITGTAQIRDAIVTNAKIANLDAAKVTTGFLAAARIAARSITTDKVSIGGGLSLSSWQMGGDETHINGGEISANTIKANKLDIGQRGITLEALEFEHNKPGNNQVSWTAGAIRYVDDAGAYAARTIDAGAVTFNGNPVYICWVKGNGALSATTDPAVVGFADHIVLAIYRGGTDLTVDVGRTIIDGSKIKTQTLTAEQITTATLGARVIAAGAITADHIQSDTIAARHLRAQIITTDHIAVGSVHANRIQAATITTDQIAVGGLHANRIAAQTITSDQIAVGGLHANRIQAGTITADRIIVGGVDTARLFTGAISNYATASRGLWETARATEQENVRVTVPMTTNKYLDLGASLQVAYGPNQGPGSGQSGIQAILLLRVNGNEIARAVYNAPADGAVLSVLFTGACPFGNLDNTAVTVQFNLFVSNTLMRPQNNFLRALGFVR